MRFALRPVTLDAQAATPVPSLVLEFAVVGLAVQCHTTPFAVIGQPPSSAIVPPEVAP